MDILLFIHVSSTKNFGMSPALPEYKEIAWLEYKLDKTLCFSVHTSSWDHVNHKLWHDRTSTNLVREIDCRKSGMEPFSKIQGNLQIFCAKYGSLLYSFGSHWNECTSCPNPRTTFCVVVQNPLFSYILIVNGHLFCALKTVGHSINISQGFQWNISIL